MEMVPWNKGNGHKTIKDFEGESDISTYFKWCFVRNPYRRITSAFASAKNLEIRDFRVFLEKIKERKGDFCIGGKWNEITDLGVGIKRIHFYPLFYMVKKEMDFVGKFESLDDDWMKICSILKKDHQPLKHHNRSVSYNFEILCDSEIRKLIYSIYEVDFDEFKYARSS